MNLSAASSAVAPVELAGRRPHWCKIEEKHEFAALRMRYEPPIKIENSRMHAK
jgi:hypothetical protein